MNDPSVDANIEPTSLTVENIYKAASFVGGKISLSCFVRKKVKGIRLAKFQTTLGRTLDCYKPAWEFYKSTNTPQIVTPHGNKYITNLRMQNNITDFDAVARLVWGT